jgi:phosphoglycerate dehydrogenase-like enzyme
MRIAIVSGVDADVIRQLGAHHEVIHNLDTKPEAVQSTIQNCDVLVFRSGVSITAELMENAPNLRLLVRAGSGLDNIDLDYVKAHNIKLERIPQPSAQAVGEMAIAMMFALARNLREADEKLRRGYWAKLELEGHLLSGKTLGIVGAGNIGARTGELGTALGMKAIGCVQMNSPAIVAELAKRHVKCVSFDEVVEHADFLSIHLPLTDATRNMINAKTFSMMKKGSYLINLARGGVVDEAALYEALVSRERVIGAALDVHAKEGHGKISPLAVLPNVILTPHIGAMTVETQADIGRRIVNIIETFDKQRKQRIETIPSYPLTPGFNLPAMTD